MNNKSKNILLVEDQILIAIPVIKVLKKAGYDVTYVMRGEDAVKIIEAGIVFDLIIMDIDLGLGICGITTSKIINTITKIPILFHTSNTEESIREAIGNTFSIYYLSKINSFTSLLHSIEKTILSFNFKEQDFI